MVVNILNTAVGRNTVHEIMLKGQPIGRIECNKKFTSKLYLYQHIFDIYWETTSCIYIKENGVPVGSITSKLYETGKKFFGLVPTGFYSFIAEHEGRQLEVFDTVDGDEVLFNMFDGNAVVAVAKEHFVEPNRYNFDIYLSDKDSIWIPVIYTAAMLSGCVDTALVEDTNSSRPFLLNCGVMNTELEKYHRPEFIEFVLQRGDS